MIAASIVTYRSGAVIETCLNGLFESTRRPLETRIFDNASDDDTLDRSARFAGRITITASARNLGFGAGHNHNFRPVLAPYFLVLNPDIRLTHGQLDRLVEHLEAHPDCGAVAPVLDEGDHPATGYSPSYPGQRYAPAAVFHRLPGSIATLQGACVLVRSWIYRDIGGFDPRFFLYAEDIDLSLSIRRRGYRLDCLEGLSVQHVGGHSERGRSIRSVTARKEAALRLFYRKHYPARTVALLFARDLLKYQFRILALQLRSDPASRRKEEAYRGRLHGLLRPSLGHACAAQPQ